MIVYLARGIPAFVMYCVNGESGSSLLIESTDSMIYIHNNYYQKNFLNEQKSRDAAAKKVQIQEE